MTPTNGKTWAALMLAASTLALTALPAVAQETTTEGDVGVTADGTIDPLLLEDGTTAEGEAGAETDVAAEEGTTDPDATVTAEDDTAEVDGDATVTAEDDTTEVEGDATVTAEGDDAEVDIDGETEMASEDDATDLEDDATVTAEGDDAEVDADTTVTAEDDTVDTDADTDVMVTAEDDAEDADDDGTQIIVEGQESEGEIIIIEGADAAEGTELAADDAATVGDDEADATLTVEGETAEGTDPAVATADAGMEADADAMMADAGAVADPADQPNADMQAVLDALAELGAPALGTVSVEEQRTSPTPADAVMAVMEDRGIEVPAEIAGILTRDITYPGADGSEIAARVYTPPEGDGPFPLIVYYHGGGWVIANIDVYDASARALAAGANAVVVSATYRQAPENPFPASHDDANAAFEWIVENSGEFNADADRLAVVGESAGGNLAFNVAVHARDAQLTPIDHMVLVYPIAGDEMTTPSYETYADAAPLSRAGMEWFFENVFADPSEAADPRIDLIARTDLEGLPPATIINAEIDPLQSEGEILAMRLMEAGVPVQQMTYPTVVHEFFGMGAVVPQAQEAVDMATAALRAAFDGTAPMTADAEAGVVTDVEATAAETPDAMVTEDDAMEMEGTTEPLEGEAATADN